MPIGGIYREISRGESQNFPTLSSSKAQFVGLMKRGIKSRLDLWIYSQLCQFHRGGPARVAFRGAGRASLVDGIDINANNIWKQCALLNESQHEAAITYWRRINEEFRYEGSPRCCWPVKNLGDKERSRREELWIVAMLVAGAAEVLGKRRKPFFKF